MVSEYCDCKDEHISGHLSLRPVADVWVHGSCLRPSYAWWRAFYKQCLECSRWFSSPESDICFECWPSERETASWVGLAGLYLAYVADRDKKTLANLA